MTLRHFTLLTSAFNTSDDLSTVDSGEVFRVENEPRVSFVSNSRNPQDTARQLYTVRGPPPASAPLSVHIFVLAVFQPCSLLQQSSCHSYYDLDSQGNQPYVLHQLLRTAAFDELSQPLIHNVPRHMSGDLRLFGFASHVAVTGNDSQPVPSGAESGCFRYRSAIHVHNLILRCLEGGASTPAELMLNPCSMLCACEVISLGALSSSPSLSLFPIKNSDHEKHF